MAKTKVLAVCIILTISFNDALRVLVFFPAPSKSHSMLGHGVANNLLAAGLEVVHVTPYPSNKPHANLKEVSLKHIADVFRAEMENNEEYKLKNVVGKENKFNSIFMIYFVYQIHKTILEDTTLTEYLKDPKETFDVVIVEWFFFDIYAGIAPLYECPLIWFGSTETHWQMLKLVDEIPNPAYNVEITSEYRPPLNFWQRASELWAVIKKIFVYKIILAPFEKMLYNSVFSEIASKRGVKMPFYQDAVNNGSFLLINSHPSIGSAYRLPQNAKYIGGVHIDTKVKSLPKDLQIIMDEAKHGVIYFSLGSNINSSTMSDAMKENLLKVFGALKQTVIWKFEEEFKNVPNNVHFLKWAPQQSILSHPNLKMFITHGGQLSTTEAVHFAVPLIGIPLGADQYVNMESVVSKGFGILVNFFEDMPSHINAAIRELLSNNTYKENAKRLSLIYHDRRNPGEELVYWVEHVVKTGGAPHLRSPAMDLPFYKRMYLDLAVVLMSLSVGFVLIVKNIYRKYKESKLIKKKTT